MQNHFDVIVVGAGPAGLFCALELSRTDLSVALVEQGGRIADSLCPKVSAGLDPARTNLRQAERFRDQCPRCSCLTGVGGAAMHFDSNLGYVRQLTRPKIEAAPDGSASRFNTLERVLGSMEVAETLIAEGYCMLARFGLSLPDSREASADHSHLIDGALFEHTDTAETLPAPLTVTLPIIQGLERALDSGRTRLYVHSRIVRIDASDGARWTLVQRGADGEERVLTADNVVLAVGKIAMPWIAATAEHLCLTGKPAETVDLGVRLETRRSDMQWMTRSCDYPKLTFLSERKNAVRTFCVCDGGRMMQYEFAGAVVLDGQHCIESPTDRINFGILTTVRTPRGTDAAQYGLAIASLVNRVAGGGPLVQTVGDFLGGKRTSSLDGTPVHSSLMRPALGDLAECLPAFLVDDIKAMISRINALAPGSIAPHALLAAPVIERAFPNIDLSDTLECSRPGLYFAGDCSGKVIGITYAMATGLRVARAIAQGKSR